MLKLLSDTKIIQIDQLLRSALRATKGVRLLNDADIIDCKAIVTDEIVNCRVEAAKECRPESESDIDNLTNLIVQ